MTAGLFAAILLGAALHAGWNALLKRGSDPLRGMVLVCLAAGVASALALPFVPAPAPAPESWPFLAASTGIHTVYMTLLAAAYRQSDLSLAYPLMRGLAPLLVTLASAVALTDPLTPLAVAGIATVSLGVLSMVRPRPGDRLPGLALLNAVVIAAYTISDGLGARASGHAVAYVLWLMALMSLPFLGWALTLGRPLMAATPRREVALGTLGGIGSLLSYGIALWAMQHAPIAVVAALRESSILFATAIAALILRERVGRARWLATGAILAGVALLRLA